MFQLDRRTDAVAGDRVALPYDQRKRSRVRVTLASGREAGIFLERGDQLRHGDRLTTEDGGLVVEIEAAPEALIEAEADSPLRLAQAAYHLGNRHVPVQILPTAGGGRLRFQADPVLAELVRGLGCRVCPTQAPFQPEAGAYAAHGGQRDTGAASAASDLHDPGHGPHRGVRRIHVFQTC